MACSNCNTKNCGCSGTYVVSQTCPPACSEVFNSACIVYTGVDIICNDTTVSPAVPTTIVHRNDYLDTALTAIVQYVCSRFNTQIHPTTVVDSGDAFILVSSNVVGAETTYTISLDPTNLPQASEVTGGVNVTVTGDGTPTTDPYVVNAQGSIVAVAPGTALSVIADADTPGPFDTTYTIDIDYDQLPDVSLITSQGYISITEQAGVPNAGDTQYTLDVDQVTVETSDDKLAVALTAAGGAPNFLRTFDVTVDDTTMAEFVMDTLNQAGPGLIGLQEGSGIGLLYDPVNHVMTISSTFTDPLKWLTVEDFAGASIDATTTTSTIVLSADATSGLSAVLSGDGNTATYTLENADKGSDQLIFGSVEVSGQPTITADSNTEVLTVVAGVDIEVTTDNVSKALTITNGINAVYSNIEGDDSVSLQAGSTTDTLDILGGDGITTSGNATGPGNNQLTITNDGVITVSAGSNITVDNADPQNPIVSTRANAVLDDTVTTQDVASTGGAVPLTHALGVQYAQIRVIANTVTTGTINGVAIVANQDITSDFAITMGSINNYTITSTTFTGNVRVIVIGA
jgi:hypothetical protein